MIITRATAERARSGGRGQGSSCLEQDVEKGVTSTPNLQLPIPKARIPAVVLEFGSWALVVGSCRRSFSVPGPGTPPWDEPSGKGTSVSGHKPEYRHGMVKSPPLNHDIPSASQPPSGSEATLSAALTVGLGVLWTVVRSR